MNPHNQHILIMAAIENYDLSLSGCMLMNPPEIIMGEFFSSGGFKAGHFNSLGIYTIKHMSDRSILATGIHGLKDDQYLVFSFCIKKFLKGLKLIIQLLEMLFSHFLPHRKNTLVIGIPLAEIHLITRFYAISVHSSPVLKNASIKINLARSSVFRPRSIIGSPVDPPQQSIQHPGGDLVPVQADWVP